MPKNVRRARIAAPAFLHRFFRRQAIFLVGLVLLLALGGSWLVWGRTPSAPPVSPAPSSPATPLAPVPADPTPATTRPPAVVAGEERSRAADVQSASAPQMLASPEVRPTPAERDNRFAVLLLGYGGGGHEGALLTDAMMVVIGDPERKTLALLSLPRDAWVPLLFDGQRPVYNKLNTAYAFARDPQLFPQRLARYRGERGAGTFARDTVARLLGIPIDSYVAFDFQSFRRLIDAVGGVDVVVPATFTARYPRQDDPRVDPGWTLVHFRAGPEHMDGKRGLEFARARQIVDNVAEGNDFARSRRQRLILTAFKNRLFQPGGLVHLPQLLAIARQYGDTDYPLPAAPDLARLVLAWQDVRLYQATLTTANYLQEGTGPDDAYVVLPAAPRASWVTVRAFARRLWADPALGQALAETIVVVVDRAKEPGLAQRVSERLAALGYAVGEPRSNWPGAQTVLRDQSEGRAGPLLSALARDLGLEAPKIVVEPVAQSPQVIVELGQDALGQIVTDLPPADPEAPASAAGSVRFGQWLPTEQVAAQNLPSTPPHPAVLTPTPLATSPDVLSTPVEAARTAAASTASARTPASRPAVSPATPTPQATPALQTHPW